MAAPDPTLSRAVLSRIIRAWKVKIRRALEPNSGSFDFWHIVETDLPSLTKWIMANWRKGMTWENYGDWQMGAVEPVRVECLDDLYRKFRYSNFKPVWRQQPGQPVVRKRKGVAA